MISFQINCSDILRKNKFVIAIVSTFLLLLWVATILSWPFSNDHGCFAWVGNVILKGKLPYKDAWLVHGPLFYYVYTLAEILFGNIFWGIRIVDVIFSLLGFYFTLKIIECLNISRGRYFAPLLYVLWYYSGGFFYTARSDSFGTVISLILMYIVFKNSIQNLYSFKYGIIAGILCGILPLFKTPYFLFVLIPIIVSFSFSNRKVTIKKPFLYGTVIGVILIFLSAIIWASYYDLIPDMIILHTKILPNYAFSYGNPSFMLHLNGVLEFFADIKNLNFSKSFALGFAVIGVLKYSKIARGKVFLLGLWSFVSLLIVIT